MKPLLVGEDNPYGANPRHALYPNPPGCAGHRLCYTVLGLDERTYLRTFDRINLCATQWTAPGAREHAHDIKSRRDGVIVLLGSKVTKAFGFAFEPWTAWSSGPDESLQQRFVILPHPSGLCRLWHEPDAYERARTLVFEYLPVLDRRLRGKHDLEGDQP